MRKVILLVILLLMLFISSIPVLAVDAGGELKATFSGQLKEDGDFDNAGIVDQLNLNLYLPRFKNNEIRYSFVVTKPLQGLMADEEVSYFTKKLYLKHRFDDFHLTVGRQPISWSFGSLLNPVDYTLGAEALDEENSSKYTDAVEVYIPVNWNSNLAFISSFPDGFTDDTDQIKWGARSRMGVKGYDLTFNYVREADNYFNSSGGSDGISGLAGIMIPKQRFGITAKGDIGNIGAYGSFGYYFDDDVESSRSYLLGVDYSYNLDYNTKISIQFEYLGLELNSFNPALRTVLLNMKTDDERLDLLTGTISYPIDDFSSLQLMAVADLDDGSLVLSPNYQNTLPSNIDLNLAASIYFGEEGSLFAPGGLMPQATTTVGLTYPF